MDYLIVKEWSEVQTNDVDAGVVCAVDGGNNFDNPWGHIVFGVGKNIFDAHNVPHYHASMDKYSGHIRQFLKH